METPELLDQQREIGKRIGAACGYAVEKTLGAIAAELGISDTTLRTYTKGKLGGKNREERLELIREIEKATGCPPWLFGLSEPAPEEVEQMKTTLAELTETTTRQASELVLLQRGQEDLRTRVEQLEHGGEGTGN